MTRRQLVRAMVAGVVASGAILGFWKSATTRGRLSDLDMAELYARPGSVPQEPLRVFHLGHSLVGRDMPAMLAQLAPKGHRYESQLGWGTTLKAHWEGPGSISGFETENAHPRFRPAREAILSGDYDSVIFTEMVELRDAIRYSDSPTYLSRWARLAREAAPGVRLYLYETWHSRMSPEGWLNRLETDLDRLWDREFLRVTLSADETVQPIFVIPAGQVLARFVRHLKVHGGLPGVTSHEDLFARGSDGSVDDIHLGDLGNYLVALTHFAVLYQRSPVGMPRELRRADGSAAVAPSAEAAVLMQETVWDVVTSMPMTGVAAGISRGS